MATIRLSDISLSRGVLPRVALGGAVGRMLSPLRHARGFSIEHLTLTIPHGTTVVILGPSGCGKSTLLRIIAGLEQPDSGQVLFNGRDVRGLTPGERKIGMLFQSYALYPHFDSRRNITSYFFFRKKTPALRALELEKFKRTSELLGVEIDYLLDRKPARLSGGEKQRVALGRCITREPELFLLDEPFSNLDAKLRAKYRLHLKKLLQEFSITTVYVTHDQQEAVLLGDTIAVMRMEAHERHNVGRLEQVGTAQELYDHPWNTFVADFLNLQGDVPAIAFLDGATLDPALAGVTLGVRPEDVCLLGEGEVGGVPARVNGALPDPLRQHMILALVLAGQELTAKLPLERALLDRGLAPGQTVQVRFRKVHVFDRASGEATREPEALRPLLA